MSLRCLSNCSWAERQILAPCLWLCQVERTGSRNLGRILSGACRRNTDSALSSTLIDLRLLEELEDRIDLADAWAALAETKKKGAKSLNVIQKDLGL